MPLPARPGRPPSRRRSRPRATGTSGPDPAPQTGAARAVMGWLKRTCVRTVGVLSDGTDTNTCTYGLLGPVIVHELACLCGIRAEPACNESCSYEGWLCRSCAPDQVARDSDLVARRIVLHEPVAARHRDGIRDRAAEIKIPAEQLARASDPHLLVRAQANCLRRSLASTSVATSQRQPGEKHCGRRTPNLLTEHAGTTILRNLRTSQP